MMLARNESRLPRGVASNTPVQEAQRHDGGPELSPHEDARPPQCLRGQRARGLSAITGYYEVAMLVTDAQRL